MSYQLNCSHGNFSSWSNTSCHHLTTVPHPSVIGWFAFTISVCIVGTVLLVLLLAAGITKTLYHGAGFLIIHLSCLQLFLCAISYPLSTVDIYHALTHEHAPLALHCPSSLFVFKVVVHAEMWASVLLAVNRCFAVALPHHYPSMITSAALSGMVIVPWVIAFAINIPLLFGIGMDLKRDSPVEYCLAMTNGDQYSTTYLVMERYLPLAIKGVLHFTLFFHIHIQRVNRKKSVRPLVPMGKPRSLRATNAIGSVGTSRGSRSQVLAKILGFSFLWKCICFLPGPISQEVYPEIYSGVQIGQFWILRTCALCGYAANPIFFFALSSDYQTALVQLL
ncbi:hypothetical protein BV898_15274 [Hypsibius exemplaris]|uniref:G-protein coupled receptors family 1 profile domain-containing protein n=1 Tax=Hypsibius exemplaris TaxID=2072580 RepID=A0A9X6NDR7_HYPEX|nr:hypothetical protein BV898_15274 [Hypsibius exemplaris]